MRPPVRAAPCLLLAPLALAHAGCDPVAPPPPPPTIVDVAIGDRHSCALSDAGETFCWGDGASGQLGTGAARSELFPVAVSGDVVFVALAAGGDHTCGLTADGEAYCWGANDRGQAGVAGAESVPSPTAVETAVRFDRLSAGVRHTCGVAVDGSAWCWGAGADGRLGDGGTADRAAPVAVAAGGEAFRAISAGGDHTCGVTTAGVGYCWGANNLGQLGTGEPVEPSLVPAAIETGVVFEDVAAGAGHSCGLATDTRIHCWGGNGHGQLGIGVRYDPDLPAEARPVPIYPGTTDYTRVGAGRGYSCGVRPNGEAQCWGLGSTGLCSPGSWPWRFRCRRCRSWRRSSRIWDTCAAISGR